MLMLLSVIRRRLCCFDSLLIAAPVVTVLYFKLCCALLCFLSIFAIIFMVKRELVAIQIVYFNIDFTTESRAKI